MNLSYRTKMIGAWLGAVILSGGLWYAYNTVVLNATPTGGQPLQARGWSEDERSANDVAVLAEFIDAKEIAIYYGDKGVSITIDKERSEQYAEQDAEAMVEKVRRVMSQQRNKLTIEDRYFVYIYSSDNRLLKIDTP